MFKRFPHNLSHVVSGSMNMGLNYPGTVIEVFPGDSFKLTASNLTRFMPQISPTYAEVILGIDFYSVPLRQLFDKLGLDWDAFLTGGENGDDNSVLPTITIPNTGYEPGGLADWLNYPCNYTDPQTSQKVIVAAGMKLNALPVVAYMHIMNENYRDQNFIAKLDLTKYQEFLDGDYAFETPAGDAISYDLLVNGLFRKAWSRDFYNRAMPNTQRGQTVRVPILGTAPVIGNGMTLGVTDGTHNNGVFAGSTGNLATYLNIYGSDVDSSLSGNGSTLNGNKSIGITTDPEKSGMVADLSGVTAIDIITFRLAARMQRFGEILQKSGARAVEFTYHMFGVRIPDARVQRPIFYGSFKLPVIFSEVLQTSSTDGTSPQGNLAGHGITGGKNKPIHVKVIEHGYFIPIVHIMPKSQYNNIIPKYLLRTDRFSIPNPLFQHVGDEEVLRKQIFPNSANPDEKFGYVPRYSDLSYLPSTIHGLFKGDMLHWTMARTFDEEPVLSAAFRYGEPSKRSFAVQNQDEMAVQIGFDIRARRLFAKNAQPGIHIV